MTDRQGEGKPAVVVFAADDGYSLPLAVAAFSAASNYQGPKSLRIIVLDGGISSEHRARIAAVLVRLGVAVEWLRVDLGVAKQLPVRGHLTPAAYARLLAPDLLPPSIEKIIYLDCDLLVEGDLSRLWAEPVGNNYLLAVQGAKHLISTSPLALIPEVAARADDPYFNSGVLVMNLRAMRREKFAERAFEFGHRWRDQIRTADQDLLNAMSIGRWRQLDPIWNLYMGTDRKRTFHYQPEGILHFTGGSKPWQPRSIRYPQSTDSRRAFNIYRRYLWSSGWFTPDRAVWHVAGYPFWRVTKLARQAARSAANSLNFGK
jgi:lipopolysaccharide biosynthesis glycosyltransferase